MSQSSTIWRHAPAAVRWTSALWFAIGLTAGVYVSYSWIVFSGLPVFGMTGMVIVEGLIEIGIATLIIVSAWQFLFGKRWARTALEIGSWIMLVGSIVDSLSWIGFALVNWEEFKSSVATQAPQVGPELKLIAGFVFSLIFIVISGLIVRALRSSTVRRYVAVGKP